MSADFYAVLQLLPSATQEDIRRRYYELAKVHHPDKVCLLLSLSCFSVDVSLTRLIVVSAGLLNFRLHSGSASLGNVEGF